MDLSPLTKSQVRYYLGYSPAVPAFEKARLETAMATVPDDFTVARIVELVDRVAIAFNNTAPGEVALLPTDKEEIVSGTSTAVTEISRRDSEATRQRIFEREAQLLANALGVVNFRDDANARNFIPGAIAVNSLPGAQGNPGISIRGAPGASGYLDVTYLYDFLVLVK